MKVYVKREKGITLIALVITIIVLLILAGIAIAALSGENGILSRASEAKQKTGREDIIEQARIKILEKQTENLGTLTEQELTEILEPTYGTLSNNGEETVLDKSLTTTDNKYEIPVKEIWNGSLQKKKDLIYFTLNGERYSCNRGTRWSELEMNKLPDVVEGYKYTYGMIRDDGHSYINYVASIRIGASSDATHVATLIMLDNNTVKEEDVIIEEANYVNSNTMSFNYICEVDYFTMVGLKDIN